MVKVTYKSLQVKKNQSFPLDAVFPNVPKSTSRRGCAFNMANAIEVKGRRSTVGACSTIAMSVKPSMRALARPGKTGFCGVCGGFPDNLLCYGHYSNKLIRRLLHLSFYNCETMVSPVIEGCPYRELLEGYLL